MDWKEVLGNLKQTQSDSFKEETDAIAEPLTEEKNKIQKTTLTVVTDRKGRKGKTATIIEGLDADIKEVEKLAKLLKQKLGTGGSFLAGEILLQGDCKKEVTEQLRKLGYKVK